MNDVQQRLDDRRAQLDRLAAARQQSGQTLEGLPFRPRQNLLTGTWAYSLTLASGLPVSGLGFESRDEAETAARDFLRELEQSQVLLMPVGWFEQQALRYRPAHELDALLAGRDPNAPAVKPVVRLYTDGSNYGHPGPAGWGALLVFEDGRELELSGPMVSATNNQAELTAVLRGLEALEESSVVTLVSDSQYVVQGLQTHLANWIRNSWRLASGGEVKNRDIWEQLLIQTQRHELTATWVKGHAGHVENERADKLAGAASLAEKIRQEAARTPERTGFACSAAEIDPLPTPPARTRPVPPSAPPPTGIKQKRRCQRCSRWSETARRLGQSGHYCTGCYELEIDERKQLTNERKELGYTR